MKREINAYNLKEGQIIYSKTGEELELRFRRQWNDNLYIFDGIVFDNDEDNDGHFSEKNEVVLTKSELRHWYINDNTKETNTVKNIIEFLKELEPNKLVKIYLFNEVYCEPRTAKEYLSDEQDLDELERYDVVEHYDLYGTLIVKGK